MPAGSNRTAEHPVPSKPSKRAHRNSLRGLVGLVTLLTTSLAAAEVDFRPSLELSATYIDNLELAGPGDEQIEDVVWEVNPTILLTHRAQRITSDLAYTMQNLFYTDDSDRNETFHQLEFSSDLTFVPDMLFLDVGASIAQQLVDPAGPANPNNLFDVGNYVDGVALRARPYLSHDFSGVQVDAEYGYAHVEYDEIDPGTALPSEDSENSAIVTSVGGADEDALISWELRYNADETDYETSADYAYEIARGELGWRIQPNFRLLAEGGAETDLSEDLASGGLDSSFWMAGFRWRPDGRNELEVRGGERFFGNTYFFRWRRQSRQLQFDVEYSEEPTTVSAVYAFQPPPATEVPPQDPTSFRLTSEAYVRRNLEGTLTLTGRRTELDLNLFGERRRYVESELTERTVGGALELTRVMSPRVSLGCRGSYTLTDLTGDRENEDYDVTLSTDFSLTSRSSLLFELQHLERSAEEEGYEVNMATLSWSYDF
jgi:hypothetical protein